MPGIDKIEGIEPIVPIRSKEGELIAIIYNDTKRKSTNIYGIKEYKLEEVKTLFEKLQETNLITKSNEKKNK